MKRVLGASIVKRGDAMFMLLSTLDGVTAYHITGKSAEGTTVDEVKGALSIVYNHNRIRAFKKGKDLFLNIVDLEKHLKAHGLSLLFSRDECMLRDYVPVSLIFEKVAESRFSSKKRDRIADAVENLVASLGPKAKKEIKALRRGKRKVRRTVKEIEL